MAASREGEGEPLLGEALADALELEVDDGGDLVAREAVEDDDLVDAVEELGAEVAAQGLGDLGLALFGVVLVEDVLASRCWRS